MEVNVPDELKPHPDHRTNLGWWTISGEGLLKMLRRVQAGEQPSLVYAEEYANCRIERH